MKKNIVLIGEAFLELEPFEHERHASGSRFNLSLELRIWNWSWPAYRFDQHVFLQFYYETIILPKIAKFQVRSFDK